MQSRTVRRLILGAALGAAGAIAFSAPAHADDSQQPGGVLDTVVEVVDQVRPEPTKAPEPEHTSEPEPEPTKETEAPAEPEPEPQSEHGEEPADEPADETTPAPDKPATPVVIDVPPVEVPVDVPPVVVDPPIVDVPPVVVDLPPVVDVPPVVVPPVVVPVPAVPVPTVPTPAPVVTPTPTQPTPVDAPTTVDPPAEQPLPAPVVEVPALPVVGPVASGTVLPGLPPWTASPEHPDREPQCTGDRDDQAAPDHGRGVVRTITDRRSGRPSADRKPAPPVKPCPTPAPPTDRAIGATATVGHVGAHSEPYAATTTGIVWPALQRLTQLRARGDLPAGRDEHIEPGPA
ncbi:Translation initiation factor IF-2 [Micromonospora saelicesensis]|uniref:Translation initiation factor IF-2 n=1 Tax=Micromonospora saelicesensis TaxID=285676 RepID=A0ABX9CAM0_9ACTN|nr:hypothetical protein [Micromonospora saelicesensis]RAN92684.1 Translation initiation factor IF-2 [Micromonospora saelicesensis]